MKYYVIKAINEDVFFNADDSMGEYMCDTPMLLDKEEAELIMSFISDEIYHFDSGKMYSDSDLRIFEVELKISSI